MSPLLHCGLHLAPTTPTPPSPAGLQVHKCRIHLCTRPKGDSDPQKQRAFVYRTHTAGLVHKCREHLCTRPTDHPLRIHKCKEHLWIWRGDHHIRETHGLWICSVYSRGVPLVDNGRPRPLELLTPPGEAVRAEYVPRLPRELGAPSRVSTVPHPGECGLARCCALPSVACSTNACGKGNCASRTLELLRVWNKRPQPREHECSISVRVRTGAFASNIRCPHSVARHTPEFVVGPNG